MSAHPKIRFFSVFFVKLPRGLRDMYLGQAQKKAGTKQRAKNAGMTGNEADALISRQIRFIKTVMLKNN